jgi:hypothetical protein
MLKRFYRHTLSILPPKVQKPILYFIRAISVIINANYRLIAYPLITIFVALLRSIKSTDPFGTFISRHYWRQYLLENKSYIRGHALEIGETATVRNFGGNAITKADSIDISPGPEVTILADLSAAWIVPDDLYDVFVNQFSMHIIKDDLAALYHSLRILKPGAKLICNFPCFTPYPSKGFNYGDIQTYVYRWYTPAGVRDLFDQLSLQPTDYTMTIYGNVYTLLAYLFQIRSEGLPRRWLNDQDPDRPFLICTTITKPERWAPKYKPEK